MLAFVIRSFLFATSVVEGASMYPTLENGERVIFNKAVYLVSEPDRGDIVIIQRPTKNYVKRVIGLPNDTIEIRDHVLYINGEPDEQLYLGEEEIQATADYGPVDVPPENYFVMGDNRSISKDSRNGLGFIEESEIIGRSEIVIYPFHEFGWTR
ncbi:signal peptidase I [Salirhabdus salicampi]|uniref:signal peptidase I n=1 Tax=Salirhabdus salicampi TaxID=476102 RepID=UPI0020C51ED5|nr:signal peptidase I [Salirhabdus salicampi]